MASFVSHLTVDRSDAYSLSEWWKPVLLERLIAHGATIVADHRGLYGPGTGWVTLADPEGNEFDILRSLAQVAEQPAPAGGADA